MLNVESNRVLQWIRLHKRLFVWAFLGGLLGGVIGFALDFDHCWENMGRTTHLPIMVGSGIVLILLITLFNRFPPK